LKKDQTLKNDKNILIGDNNYGLTMR